MEATGLARAALHGRPAPDIGAAEPPERARESGAAGENRDTCAGDTEPLCDIGGDYELSP
jgi:hypothetical protein